MRGRRQREERQEVKRREAGDKEKFNLIEEIKNLEAPHQGEIPLIL